MTTERHAAEAEDLAREAIEQAFRDHVGCARCGAEMVMLMRGDTLRIECGDIVAKDGLRYLLASGFHDSFVVEFPAELLAA